MTYEEQPINNMREWSHLHAQMIPYALKLFVCMNTPERSLGDTGRGMGIDS